MPSLTPEFDVGAELLTGTSRREFLRLVGASAALLSSGCAQRPSEKILPYGANPPELTPGNPLHYATAFVLDGLATGILATSNEGRPTKIEGNPRHPASLGAAGAYEQASVLSLYDPERASAVFERGVPRDHDDLRAWLDRAVPERGEGLFVLMEPTSSPTLVRLIGEIRARLPGATLVFHSNAGRPRPVLPRPDLLRADAVLVLGGDPFTEGPMRHRLAHDFAARRRAGLEGKAAPSRLWVIEPILTPTGSVADRRLRARAADIPFLAQQIFDGTGSDFVKEVGAELRQRRGRAVVLAGERQPEATHAICARLNAAIGAPIAYGPSPIFEAGAPSHDIETLTAAIDGGRVKALLVLGGNPAFGAAPDLELARRIGEVAESAYLGTHLDETAKATRWFVPQRHDLESWGDARAYDGTASIIQPLVAPLVPEARSPLELLALVAAVPGSMYALVRDTWRPHASSPGTFEPFWEMALQVGSIDGTAAPADSAPPDDATVQPAPPGIELVLSNDAKVHDGRFAGNAWLQELPAPMTKLTWGNAAVISPALATRLGAVTGDHLEIAFAGKTLTAPCFILPGTADDSVGLTLGYGRRSGPEIARGHGVDASGFRTAAAPWGGPGAEIRRASGRTELAFTQEHASQEGRPIALVASFDELDKRDVTEGQRGPLPTLLADSYTTQAQRQWGMVIDLSLCTGCSACVVACQAENNIPVVGPEGVRRSREMHWIRIDRYFEGDEVVSQPMLCQHCEKAPCEYVCPTNATVHSDDGLNEMVYNRCIGTRFCSNNCPYKVRRFNFLSYVDESRTLLQKNPDVTVRQRGVMEKCTYCVQRIRRGEIRARLEGRELGGEEVKTACQQTCPTQAITFGSITDKDSAVARLREDRRAYSVLHELGTKPRTRYLVKVKS